MIAVLLYSIAIIYLESAIDLILESIAIENAHQYESSHN